MLSRVAESIFWMSRYIERAENVARFIDVNLNLTLDLGLGVAGQWAPLIYTTGDQEGFSERYGDPTQENVLHFLAFDEKNGNSIRSCYRRARENARTVRDMISSAMWEELNKAYLTVEGSVRSGGNLEELFEFFSRVRMASHLVEGVTDATMSHGEAWHFARLGRMIERADKTSRILDVKYYLLLPSVTEVGTPLDTIQWSALLKSASALEMYRKAHGRITPAKVVEFLVLDREFPRAVQYCLGVGEESVLAISGNTRGPFRNLAEQLLGRLRSELAYMSVQEIIKGGLHEFVDGFQNKLNMVGEAVHTTFFALTPETGHDDQVQTMSAGTRSMMQAQRSG
ncbi:MAG TPA: alpha-E domain-containing protein [Pirellulales bacterium]|nr:alpha-E domain-containing protein [Pirellulales bacterium]